MPSVATSRASSAGVEAAALRGPAAIASVASTVSWQVKALVEATPISGPARIGSATSLSRAIVEVSTLTTETMRPPCALT